MNDENENNVKPFCDEHGARSGTICRTVKDIKEIKETVVQNRRDLEQKITGSDMAHTEAITRAHEVIESVAGKSVIRRDAMLKRIDSVDSKKMDSKTFVLIVAIFGSTVLGSIGFNWAIQNKSSDKMTKIVQEHSKENQAATKELVSAMNNMALKVGNLETNIANLDENFDEYKRWNETEHQMFRQSTQPFNWRPNGAIK